ncbi:MAG: DUF362 domain-containing protein [bacterium]
MSRVVVIRRAVSGEPIPFARNDYRQLLESGLKLLCSAADVSTALHELLPGGPVGMKPNCVAHDKNSTSVALADALSDLLEESGWAANDLIVWERTSQELRQAGFKLNAASFGRRCLGTDAHPTGYSHYFYTSGEVNSLVSSILTETVNSNINLPILKDHSLAGLSCGLKNMYGAINNPNKYHDNNCDPHVAHVNNLAPIKKTQRLTVVDAVSVQYHRGPGYSPKHVAWYGGIVLSKDPVAADIVGLTILEHLRTSHGLPTLEASGRPAKYLSSAEFLGLGTAQMDQIDLEVRVLRDDGRLVAGELW